MRWPLALALVPLMLAMLLGAACFRSPLSAFNLVVPKDGGVRLVASGIAYGPHPRQKLDIYAPVATAAAPGRPVIMFFYGGSWSSGNRAQYAFVGRALAAQGFIVVIPDYRLVPEVHFPIFLEDCAVAVHWVRGHIATFAKGDPDRIILAGHSAGAYNAAMLSLDPHWLGDDRKAVRGLIGLAGPYDFAPFDDSASIAAFGQWPDRDATQPVKVAVANSPPAFLATGDRDMRVRARNSDNLAIVLARGGTVVERRRYPAVDHVGMLIDLARPFRGRAPILHDAIGFARKVTGTSP